MYWFTSEINSGDVSKFGKPCDKLMAWCSLASADMIVKIVVPAWGSFDLTVRGNVGMREMKEKVVGVKIKNPSGK